MDGHQAQALRETIRYAIEDGLRDAADTLTPGSPAYVRALRDRAAVDRYNRDPECSEDVAISEANALVKALGYEPPGESP